MGKLKLKQQLFILITVFVAALAIFEIYVNSTMYSLISSGKEAYAYSLMAQLEKTATQLHSEIRTAAIAISYNTATQEYLTAADVYERQQYERVVIDMCINLKFSDNIETIVFFGKNGRPISTLVEDEYYAVMELSDRYSMFPAEMSEPFYSGVLTYFTPGAGADTPLQTFAYVFPIKSISAKNNRLFENIASCVILIGQDTVYQMIRDISQPNSSYIYVLDMNGQVLASEESGENADSGEILRLNEIIGSEVKNGDIIEYFGKECILHYVMIPELSWNIISVMPVDNIASDLHSIRNFSLMIILLFSLFSIFAMILFFYSLSRPIRKLTEFMQNVSNGDSSRRLQYDSGNEVGMLSNNINQMLDRIAEANRQALSATKELMGMEINQKHTQLTALQSQINPHFLYNTLDCIRGIALSHRLMNIVDITTCMADIFRYSIQGDIHSTVGQELLVVEKYLNIIAIRFAGKIQFQIQAEEAILDTPAPKMILQPIVENAVYHGLEKRRGDGMIVIVARTAVEGRIELVVSDNGIGIPPEELERLNQSFEEGGRGATGGESRSIGLVNIHRRIKLFLGEPYGIAICSTENRGTSVSLSIPGVPITAGQKLP